ncbi:MAG: type II toxin-antitoxin system prevent-host-death family antitoxin [Acidimicrobiaceae bacterium]|nr:type II toxin-antitoxin system prevent-host-death family antitoxin [Acidimicrobiaceae bacterium]
MEVGVRDLKTNLSRYLKRASSGEVITVTDRGRAVASLGPAYGEIDLAAAADEGWITLPVRSGFTSVKRHKARHLISSILEEDRAR